MNATADPGESDLQPPAWSLTLQTEVPTNATQTITAEIMLLSLGGIILVGEPGEVFSETAVTFRTRLRLMGYKAPLLVSYANDWLAYLPVSEAFDEGGYEPGWAVRLGISRHFQTRVWEAISQYLGQKTTGS